MKEVFKLPKLPYEYKNLEPHIDVVTMETHHSKHHASYVKKLNEAIESFEELHTLTIEEILSDISIVPDEIEQSVINNGGGHANHSFFWEIMSPTGNKNPTGKLAKEINAEFGNFENFKEQFKKCGLSQFGSGWVWLVTDENKKLTIISTSNQDSPLSISLSPILTLDVWEHAYYLKYKNLRNNYIDAWWNVVNWEKANEHYIRALD